MPLTRKNLKAAAIDAAYRMGTYDVLKSMNNIAGKRLTVVTYHRVTDGNIGDIDASLNNLFVNTETFERQILFFKRRYRIVHFRDLLGMAESGTVPADTMVVTFDDGYLDFSRFAYPIIAKHWIPVTLFLVPGKMGCTEEFPFWWDEMFYLLNRLNRAGPAGPEQAAADRIHELCSLFQTDMKLAFDGVMERNSDEEIKGIIEELRIRAGAHKGCGSGENALLDWGNVAGFSELVEIGSHTLNHRNLRFLSGESLRVEVRKSKEIIEERTGRDVTAFSYPNGYHNPEIVSIVRESGYRFAVTTERGVDDLRDPFLVKRINLWERSSSVWPNRYSESKLALKLAGL